MLYGGLDLAEKMTGMVILDQQRTVVRESWLSDSNRPMALNRMLKSLDEECQDAGEPLRFHIEDLFPAGQRDLAGKGAVRNQGRVLDAICQWETVPIVRWIMPSHWQVRLGYNRRASPKVSTKMWAKLKCIELGYTPPEWSRGSKALEDLRDAYLIAYDALINGDSHG